MKSKARLDIGSLILVNDVGLGQLVQHLLDGGIHLYGLFLVGYGTQFAHSVAHGFGVVLVMQRPCLLLTDSLD